MKKLIVIGVLVVGTGLAAWLQPELRNAVLEEVPVGGVSKPTTVYKWQDSSGNWHVSDKPPQEDRSVQTLEYSANVNVLPLPPKLQDR